MTSRHLPTLPYKGTRDFYPEDMEVRNWFFGKMKTVVEQYGYEEYNGPILEPYDLYSAKSGQELVNEQVYHFTDRGGREVAIRPEMTPTVARMVAARQNQLTFPLRWYSIANLMRYERPQKGRLREHWQLNVDVFGEGGGKADLEIMSIVVDLMRAFGADASMFKIKISNRRFFNDVLTELLDVGESEIQVISKAVDKRSKISREEYDKWLTASGITRDKIALLDQIFALSLDELVGRLKRESRGTEELRGLIRLLRDAGLDEYGEFDFSVVRGFDYYTGTIFEVYDTSPENRRALFGGGRYDDLIGLFKESDISGIGFGFGDVTFQHFLEIHNLLPSELRENKKVLIATFDDTPYAEYLGISAELRAKGIANCIYLEPSTKLKKQLQFAERKNFPVVLILGSKEMESGKVVLKQMIAKQQITCDRGHVVRAVRDLLND